MLIKEIRVNKRTTQDQGNRNYKHVSILDEDSICYIEGRECLDKLAKEQEEEERQLNPKPQKKRRRRRSY